jgi:tetratricopeptide (TPR) repeat protein
MKRIKRGKRSEDQFLTTMNKVTKLIVRNRELSIWIGAGIVVVLALLIYFTPRGEPQNPEADLLSTQAMGLITMGRFQEAENILLDLTQRHKDTRSGKIGLYYLGVLTYHTGRFGEAVEYFDKFLGRVGKDYLLAPSALMGAGCAAEGLKDYDRALTYYKRLIRDKKSPFYHQGMLSYGRVSGIIGNIEEAKKILNKLIDEDPSQDIVADARFYLGYFNTEKPGSGLPPPPQFGDQF